MLDINGEDIAAADYDLFVNSSSDDLKIRQALESLAQSFVQNGSSASTLINVLKSESIAESSQLLEEDEDRRRQAEEANQKAQLQSQEKIAQMTIEEKQKDRDLGKYRIDKDFEIRLLEIQAKLGTAPSTEESGEDMETAKHEETIRHNRATEDEKKRANQANEEIRRKQASSKTTSK